MQLGCQPGSAGAPVTTSARKVTSVFKAIVDHDITYAGVRVTIGRRLPDLGYQIVNSLSQAGVEYTNVPEDQVNTTVLRIPDEITVPLLDALARHYAGTTDMRTLRQDYLHERDRVDKLITHLMTARSPGADVTPRDSTR